MPSSDESKMTTKEREELRKLVRQRAKLAVDAVLTRAADMRAEVEARLAATFRKDDERWAAAAAKADKAVEEVNVQIAECFREQGVPQQFWPRMTSYFLERGENGSRQRRQELHRAAEAAIDAMVRTAKLEVQRNEERQLTQLAMGGITTAEARSYLENMPVPEQLLLPIRQVQLTGGEIVVLEAEETVTPGVLVTVERNGVTEERVNCHTCIVCTRKVVAGRGLYCSDACWQAAYRKRHRAAK